MIDQKIIRLAFYRSSDGPRVMLFGPMPIDWEPLRHCFVKLSQGPREVELDQLPFVHAVGVRLRLRSLGDQPRGAVRQKIQRQSSSDVFYTWSQSSEDWELTVCLLDGLIESPSPGHQYLARYPDGDATVVISKGEYSDEVLDVDEEFTRGSRQ